MLIQFRACVEVPDDAPISDVEKWLAFELGVRCQLDGSNRMARQDLKALEVINLEVIEQTPPRVG